ncbi:SpoIIE family protein phosphatase [Geodermatophilus sp. SYSU D00742]
MDPEAAHDPGLLLQAVEGMERPLFVLDADWRFRYINPAGARVLDRTVGELLGRDVWTEFPQAVGGPFEELYRTVSATGVSGSVEAWFEPLDRWFRADAFRTDAGLVVTYDDVTERRRTEQERSRAAAEAERTGRHLMLLGDINLAMTSTVDVDEAVGRFAQLVVPLLADWCLVSVVDPDGTRRDVGRAHSDPAMVEVMHRYADSRVRSNAPSAPVPQSLRSGRPVVIEALTAADVEGMVSDADARRLLEALQPAAVATFPLVARGEVIGAFTLVNGPERGPHTPAELRTAEIASRRAALALDNARLALANQQVAERLQVSLLSPPVQPDHMQLAVRYRAATRGVAIGGDWYDSFLQPDGDTVVVIGDVMGHDIEAAAAMGQVKTLVRAIAFDRLEEPAGVLRRVDHALVGLAVPAMATALVCRVEQSPEDREAGVRRLRWATAGHPEPMLLNPDGTVTDLSAPVGPPLGIGWRGPRAGGQVVLPDGATLLLFTDGLFERRGVLLDDRRDQLRRLLAASREETLDELADRLLAEMVGEGTEDDVALLAVRLYAQDRPPPPVPGPVLVQPVARRP